MTEPRLLLQDDELDDLPNVTVYPPTFGGLADFFRESKKQVAKAHFDEIIRVLRKLGWDRAVDDLNLYCGGTECIHVFTRTGLYVRHCIDCGLKQVRDVGTEPIWRNAK